jgi:hypothetical protein
VQVHKKEIRKTSKLSKSMVSIVPNDAVFQARVGTMTMTNHSLARFYLHEIQDAASTEGGGGNRDERKIDLEHVIPKSAEERKIHWPELTAEAGEALCTRLGNLTLCLKRDNSALNGRGYSEKSKVYAGYNNLPLTSAIARDYPTTFGEAEVTARQDSLAKLAVEAWPI